jgi:hypothetical protein
MAFERDTEPILSLDGAALEPADSVQGRMLVEPAKSGLGGMQLHWSGVAVSIVAHLFLLLWIIGFLGSAQKLPGYEAVPVTLVPAETVPPPPASDAVPPEFEAPAVPLPRAGPSPAPNAEAAEDGELEPAPGFDKEQAASLAELLDSLGLATPDAPTALSDELRALVAQAKRCWSLPEGWSDPGQVSVTVGFVLDRDGAVRGPPKVIEFSASELGKAAADSAVRAVLECGPFELPKDKYEQWREVQLRFTP